MLLTKPKSLSAHTYYSC